MKILVTGSAGHLGEALMRSMPAFGHDAVGLDIKSSPFTQLVGSITNSEFVDECMHGVDAVIHTATLHKPHVVTHTRHSFVDTNITGTLNLLEAAASRASIRFVFTSTTSAFGHALVPEADEPATWITEEVRPRPKNIYGVTKLSAESLCELIHEKCGLPCLVLRTSRFFPEEDDDGISREAYVNDNMKVNELLYRRADIEDVVNAHLLAVDKAPVLGFDKFVISATTPFREADLQDLRFCPERIICRFVPDALPEYQRRGWAMPASIDRVYVNDRARAVLGWQPRYDYRHAIKCLSENMDYQSALARAVGSKGYHAQQFYGGPYPTEGA